MPITGAALLAVFGARRWAPEANVLVSIATFTAACALTARVIRDGSLTTAGDGVLVQTCVSAAAGACDLDV
jgi:hypothetical protein